MFPQRLLNPFLSSPRLGTFCRGQTCWISVSVCMIADALSFIDANRCPVRCCISLVFMLLSEKASFFEQLLTNYLSIERVFAKSQYLYFVPVCRFHFLKLPILLSFFLLHFKLILCSFSGIFRII